MTDQNIKLGILSSLSKEDLLMTEKKVGKSKRGLHPTVDQTR